MIATADLDAEPPALPGMLGVLGGMGPLATVYSYRRVVEATPATRDQDHIPVVIWGDPTVPDRSAALARQDAPNPTPWLLRGARALSALGAEIIAVPYNIRDSIAPGRTVLDSASILAAASVTTLRGQGGVWTTC